MTAPDGGALPPPEGPAPLPSRPRRLVAASFAVMLVAVGLLVAGLARAAPGFVLVAVLVGLLAGALLTAAVVRTPRPPAPPPPARP